MLHAGARRNAHCNQIAMAEVRVDIGDQKLIVKTDGELRHQGFKTGKDITILRVILNGYRQDNKVSFDDSTQMLHGIDLIASGSTNPGASRRYACRSNFCTTEVLKSIAIQLEHPRRYSNCLSRIHLEISKLTFPVSASNPLCPWKLLFAGRLALCKQSQFGIDDPMELPNNNHGPGSPDSTASKSRIEKHLSPLGWRDKGASGLFLHVCGINFKAQHMPHCMEMCNDGIKGSAFVTGGIARRSALFAGHGQHILSRPSTARPSRVPALLPQLTASVITVR
ncbi:MAG: hypothetical protein GPOALKHO_000081 [Sodalis sp.]|nr:MAG: hypothetical protein GPOALKHO_000081 [Sodalis sp.]